jgi:hypothetical protein
MGGLVRGLVRGFGRKPNMLQECFNLFQLLTTSPYEGLAALGLALLCLFVASGMLGTGEK